MVIWLFNTIQEAKSFIQKKWACVWDRIIIMWSEQTTYEFNGREWINISWIYLKWDTGEPWKWEKGKDADLIDYDRIIKWVVEMLRSNNKFISSLKWQPWEPWKSIKWDKWDKWDSPDSNKIIDIISNQLKNDKSFISLLKAKDGITPKKWVDYFDWKDWENWKTPIAWIDYPIPLDWEDWSKWILIEDPANVNLEIGQRGIDYSKNIYTNKNNNIIKL